MLIGVPVLAGLGVVTDQDPGRFLVWAVVYVLLSTAGVTRYQRRQRVVLENRLRLRPSVTGTFACTVEAGPGKRRWKGPGEEACSAVAVGAPGVVMRPSTAVLADVTALAWEKIDHIEVEDRSRRPLVALVAADDEVIVVRSWARRSEVEATLRSGLEAAELV